MPVRLDTARHAIGSRGAAAVLVALACASLGLVCPGPVYRVVLGDHLLEYWRVDVRRIDDTASEYTFRARLTNRGAAPDEVIAWVTSAVPDVRVRDGDLRFGPLGPGESAPSRDEFRVRHDRSAFFRTGDLQFLEMDRYLGWKGIRSRATGHFRVEQIDGVDWFITPLGHGFYCAGVTGFDPGGDTAPSLGTSPYHDAILAKYGSEEAWSEVAIDRFRSWNLACVGGWTNPSLFHDQLPYALNGGFLARAPSIPGWPAGLTGVRIRDVFDPAYPANAAAYAENFRDCAENPWCIGVYTDNELGMGPSIFQEGTWFDAYMTLPAGAPGKLALQAFLEDRYGGDVAALNAAWGTDLASFDEIQDRSSLGLGIDDDGPAALEDRLDFLGLAASRYFQVAHDALRAVSPELLILGARFSPPFTNPRAIAASAPYVDVVSLNDYEFDPIILLVIQGLADYGNLFLSGPFRDLKTVHELTGRPLMITEYFYRLERGTSQPPGLPEVPDEATRVTKLTRYMDRMLARPYVIGTHWFQYQDQPVEGRGDGENQVIGLVDIEDEPHAPLVERLTELNGAIPPLRASLAVPTP